MVIGVSVVRGPTSLVKPLGSKFESWLLFFFFHLVIQLDFASSKIS